MYSEFQAVLGIGLVEHSFQVSPHCRNLDSHLGRNLLVRHALKQAVAYLRLALRQLHVR